VNARGRSIVGGGPGRTIGRGGEPFGAWVLAPLTAILGCTGLATHDDRFEALVRLARVSRPSVPGALVGLRSSSHSVPPAKARWALPRLGRTSEPRRRCD
jgi:hypothetical protein